MHYIVCLNKLHWNTTVIWYSKRLLGYLIISVTCPFPTPSKVDKQTKKSVKNYLFLRFPWVVEISAVRSARQMNPSSSFRRGCKLASPPRGYYKLACVNSSQNSCLGFCAISGSNRPAHASTYTKYPPFLYPRRDILSFKWISKEPNPQKTFQISRRIRLT